jgi:hypothetical protein
MSWRALRPILLGVPLVFAAWGLMTLALTVLFQPPGRPVAVFASGGVGPAIEAVAAADGYVLQVRGGTVIAIARDQGFVPRLYRSGALLVLAASAGGCIVVQPAAAASRPSA